MLGALGDVNKIEDPAIHASVFEHLCDLQDTLQRVCIDLDPVVQSIVSLRSSLVFKILTVLVSTISN